MLGNGETCTGDPARRAGNEFVFQGLAQQNVETFKEAKVKKVVSTCAHCFNTLKNEYKDFGVELEVVHHTQLLNRLVREGKLTPVKRRRRRREALDHLPRPLLPRPPQRRLHPAARAARRCSPAPSSSEMPRNSERSFCCGAGGARMWMEENIGERINVNRTKEAVGTGADQIAVGCPFCRVMLSDGLTAQQAKGEAREEVEVLDVAQMLLASVKGAEPVRPDRRPPAEAAPRPAPRRGSPRRRRAPTEPGRGAEPAAPAGARGSHGRADRVTRGRRTRRPGWRDPADEGRRSARRTRRQVASPSARSAGRCTCGGRQSDYRRNLHVCARATSAP